MIFLVGGYICNRTVQNRVTQLGLAQAITCNVVEASTVKAVAFIYASLAFFWGQVASCR
jgi:hypothetical protein